MAKPLQTRNKLSDDEGLLLNEIVFNDTLTTIGHRSILSYSLLPNWLFLLQDCFCCC